ncbi:MAG TPA: DoxX family protein [Chitinophagaceae bacterium]|nr:DoxX family protein [Chitinophagaceae bacterium]
MFSKSDSISLLIVRIVPAIILMQTLFFKFTAAPESVEIFTKLHAEPWGRIATGILELISGILLLIPPTALLGASLGLVLMCGAIASHLFVIGIESAGDRGQLFTLAIIVFVCCIAVIYLEKRKAGK